MHWQPQTGWKMAITGQSLPKQCKIFVLEIFLKKQKNEIKLTFELFRVARTMGLRGEALFARWPLPPKGTIISFKTKSWSPNFGNAMLKPWQGWIWACPGLLLSSETLDWRTGQVPKCALIMCAKKCQLAQYCNYDDVHLHRRGNQGIQRCLDTIKTLVEKVLLKYSWRGSLLFSALDTWHSLHCICLC